MSEQAREVLLAVTMIWGSLGWLLAVVVCRMAWKYKSERDQQHANYHRVLKRLPPVRKYHGIRT